jgi:T5SS/PEP-CTERM-associated repeat protein
VARTFTWIGPAGATFDGPGDWADITTGQTLATTAVPGSLDTAVFAAAASGLTGPGLAGTVDVTAAVTLAGGTLQFGNLAVTRAALAVGAGATLHYTSALHTTGQAALTVGGAGASLAVGGAGASVAVSGGSADTAYLQILAGATLSLTQGGSLDADVLDLAGSTAAAVVDGAGSLQTTAHLSTRWLAVGDGATASATVRNHAVATLGLVTVGFGEQTGSGTGTLQVQAAATVNASGYAAIGYSLDDTGSVTLDGVGTWFSSAGLFVGNSGSGKLTIENGATVQTGVEAGQGPDFAGAIANLPGSAGSVLVSGQGSSWTLAGRYNLGVAGFATLDVLGGAAVRSTVAPVATVENAATTYEGAFSLVTATVLVQGAGSTLAADKSPIWIGNNGTASLTVAAGGSVSAVAPAPGFPAVAIGLGGGTGTLVVTGLDSTFTAAGQLAVGGSLVGASTGGTGLLSIAAGGHVAVSGDLDIGDGVATASRIVMLDAGTLTIGGDLDDADGTLALGQGAVVTVGPAVTLGSAGLVTVAGGGMEIGGTGHAETGSVVIDQGALLTGLGQVQGVVVNAGSIAVPAGGRLVLGGLQNPDAQVAGVLGIAAHATADIGMLVSGTMNFVGAGELRLHTRPATPEAVTIAIGAMGGTIDLVGLQATDATFSAGDLVVNIAGAGPLVFTLAEPPPASNPVVVPDGGTGSDIMLPCFARGTRIRTARGETEVEALRPGDLAVTAAGRCRPVVWVGSRTLDCRRHARPQDVLPVRVLAGAFAPGRPLRDLVLSPDHAVLCGGVLIPVRYLQNGRTVVQEQAARVAYFHVELATHDVLLAEGLPVESFLDTGNRAAFSGAGVVALHPDFARRRWAERGCARLALTGAPVTRTREALLRRAMALGYAVTDEADLRVFAGRKRLPAQVAASAAGIGMRWQVALPPDAAELRLISRVWVPAHTRAAETDMRRLGVPIRGLWLDGRPASLDSPALANGWHAAEPELRWTTGDARLPVAGVRSVVFDVAMAGSYWAPPSAGQARGARERERPGTTQPSPTA